MTPRLLAVDLDGTLLDRHGAPHAADLAALKAALAKGIHVTIVTGRLFSGTRETADAVGIRGPVVCADGSHVVEAHTRRTLVHHGVTGTDALALRDIIAASGAATFLFANDAIVHDQRGAGFLEYVTAWSPAVIACSEVANHALWHHEPGITAVVAVGEERSIKQAAAGIEAALGHTAHVLHFPVGRWGQWGLISRSRRSSKGSALTELAAQLGLDMDEVVAVGDWLNDVPMFEVAGRSFVMGHAPDEVKRTATDVLEATRETGGGVARALYEAFGVSS